MFYAEISSNRGTVKGTKNSDGCLINVEGPYSGNAQVCFYSREEIEKLKEKYRIFNRTGKCKCEIWPVRWK